MNLELFTLEDIIIELSNVWNNETKAFLNEYIGIFWKTKNPYLIMPIIINNITEWVYYWRISIFSIDTWDILYKTWYFQSDSLLYLILFLLNNKDIMTYIDEDTWNWLWLFISQYRFITRERVRVIKDDLIKDLQQLLTKKDYENK